MDAKERELLEELEDLPEVIEAHILFGEYDLIVKIKVGEAEDAAAFVMDKLRARPEVKYSSTLIVAK